MLVYAVELRWAEVAALPLADLLPALDEDRRQRIARFLRTEDKYRCAFAGLLQRFLFRAHHGPGVEPPSLMSGPFGRPSFRGLEGFDFNLAHSGTWVVGAGHRARVGIDVEAVGEPGTILECVLSARERAALRLLPEAEQTARFVELWTLKEAQAKALGTGLQLRLDRLTFEVSPGGVAATLDGRPSGWRYRLYPLHAGYRLAVCAREDVFPPEVTILDARELARNALGATRTA